MQPLLPPELRDECSLAWRRADDHFEQLRKPVASDQRTCLFSLQHHDGNRERHQILLKREISIDRKKNVELLCRKHQELAIDDRGPAHLTCRLHVMTDKIPRQAPIDALIEEDPQATDSISRFFASSRNATTCSRYCAGYAPPG